MFSSKKVRAGFTLVELLVVIAIIGVLILPVLEQGNRYDQFNFKTGFASHIGQTTVANAVYQNQPNTAF